MTRQLPLRRVTTAQARILAEIARGGSHADVAARLHLTETTVAHTMADARKRVGATSSVHLLALAIAAGDIPADVATGTAAPRDC
jgi:DNA-binding CsgD family transcriptional regulator